VTVLKLMIKRVNIDKRYLLSHISTLMACAIILVIIFLSVVNLHLIERGILWQNNFMRGKFYEKFG